MGQLILGRCRYQLPNGVSQSRHFLRSPITTGLLHSVQITRMRTSTGKIPAFLRRFCKRLTHWKLTRRVSSDWGRRGSDHFLRHSDHSWCEVWTLFLWFFSVMYIFFYLFISEHLYFFIYTQFIWIPLPGQCLRNLSVCESESDRVTPDKWVQDVGTGAGGQTLVTFNLSWLLSLNHRVFRFRFTLLNIWFVFHLD